MKSPRARGQRYTTIDEYIRIFPPDVQNILEQIREIIHEIVPEAEETIKYGIPTFTLNGNLVHFGAYPGHIGFYPTPSAIEAFEKELSPYEHSKGTIRFRLDKPVPFDLVRRMVRFRTKELREAGKKRK